ncbi:MAG: hypothetical protein PHY34_05945 [Patescibacteria group bacterium]|nr:hypothetical protein [Patescibacteria group bacterium]MDD5716046.1 hypothetical protein [Patescibacteria group bacterium]
MFLNARINPTPGKHAAYIISAGVFGFLIGLLVHAVAEDIYLQWAIKNDHTITWYAGCSLHPAVQIGLVIVSIAGGLGLGKMWWRLVYIERRWATRGKQKNDPTSTPSSTKV